MGPSGAAGALADLDNPPELSSDDLGDALKAAHRAYGCPTCHTTGTIIQDGEQVVCPECEGNPAESMSEEAYAKFCRLGQVLAFVGGDEEEGALFDRKAAARRLLERVGTKADNVREIARQARLLVDDSTRLSSGVLFAGKVEQVSSSGDSHGLKIKLARGPEGGEWEAYVILVRNEPFQVEEGANVVGMGSLILSPSAGEEEEPAGDAEEAAEDKAPTHWVMCGAVAAVVLDRGDPEP
jgi:hypothetical protein